MNNAFTVVVISLVLALIMFAFGQSNVRKDIWASVWCPEFGIGFTIVCLIALGLWKAGLLI